MNSTKIQKQTKKGKRKTNFVNFIKKTCKTKTNDTKPGRMVRLNLTGREKKIIIKNFFWVKLSSKPNRKKDYPKPFWNN